VIVKTTVSATVTPGKVLVRDAQGKDLMTLNGLNQGFNPLVTIPLPGIGSASNTVGATVAAGNPVKFDFILEDLNGVLVTNPHVVTWWLSDVDYSTGFDIFPTGTLPDQPEAYVFGNRHRNIGAGLNASSVTEAGKLSVSFQHDAGAMVRFVYVVINNVLIQGDKSLEWT